MAKEAPAKPVIVAAVGSSAGHPKAASKPNPPGPKGSSIEQAMAEAVTKAMAAGVTDQDEIRRLQLEARDKAKAGK
jgi:hypothetical protein